MLKVAVIGVGSMGKHHARNFIDIPNVNLVGVSDIDEKTAYDVAKRCACKAYTDYLKMLDDLKPDAVTVAVPTKYHKKIAVNVLNRGLDLLLEKPIASEIDEGEMIIAAAKRNNTKLMIGHTERFNPAIIDLRKRIQANECGRIIQIDARRQGPFPNKNQDEGVIIDLAVHDLDIMRYITGAEFKRIFSETESTLQGSGEDLSSTIARLSDGTIGTLTINWLTPTKIRELCIIGEKGMFRVDYLTQDLFFFENATTREDRNWIALHLLRGSVREGRMIRHVISKKEPLRLELEAFTNAVLKNEPVTVTGEDGLKALMLAKAMIKSGIKNKAITFNDITDNSINPNKHSASSTST